MHTEINWGVLRIQSQWKELLLETESCVCLQPPSLQTFMLFISRHLISGALFFTAAAASGSNASSKTCKATTPRMSLETTLLNVSSLHGFYPRNTSARRLREVFLHRWQSISQKHVPYDQYSAQINESGSRKKNTEVCASKKSSADCTLCQMGGNSSGDTTRLSCSRSEWQPAVIKSLPGACQPPPWLLAACCCKKRKSIIDTFLPHLFHPPPHHHHHQPFLSTFYLFISVIFLQFSERPRIAGVKKKKEKKQLAHSSSFNLEPRDPPPHPPSPQGALMPQQGDGYLHFD